MWSHYPGGYTRTALPGPLPLMQIAIGALLAWPTFGLHVEFDPELFLVLFIPPLLFADGWKTPTREFLEHGRDLRPALALVVVTVVGIGFLITGPYRVSR